MYCGQEFVNSDFVYFFLYTESYLILVNTIQYRHPWWWEGNVNVGLCITVRAHLGEH